MNRPETASESPRRTNLSLRQLEAFIEAHRGGTLAAAAERLGVTASAASLMLKQLEQSLGVSLFDRGPRGLQATEAGVAAVELARQVLDGATRLEHLAHDLAELRQGALRIGATPAIAAHVLPPVLRRFIERHPGIALTLDDSSPDQLGARLAADQIDLALGTPEADPDPQVEAELLIRDRLCVICLHDDALAGGDAVRWSQLEGARIITVHTGSGIRSLVDQALAQSGVRVELAFEVSLFTTALALVGQGLGRALLPSFLLSFAGDPRLVARPLAEPAITRDICLMHRASRSLSPAARAFAELVRAEIGD